MSLTAMGQSVLFNASIQEVALKHNPKIVRTEREELRDNEPRSTSRYLQELSEFNPEANTLIRWVYRPNGVLSVREDYQFGADGHLVTLKAFDSSGLQIRIRKVRQTGPGLEEGVLMDSAGRELERTLTRRDQDERVLESISTDSTNGNKIQLNASYNAHGQPSQAEVTFTSGEKVTQRLSLDYTSNQRVVFTSYDAKGALLFRNEMLIVDSDEVPVGSLLTNAASGQSKTEQITKTDDKGNWTEKTIVERDQGTSGLRVIIRRTITY